MGLKSSYRSMLEAEAARWLRTRTNHPHIRQEASRDFYPEEMGGGGGGGGMLLRDDENGNEWRSFTFP